ncbi:MAG TPA: DUF72 domain-containing protein [Gammaproteobacteria bacterium]
MKPARIHIGTSGWSYAHWKGPFYPADLSDDRQMLEYYTRHFRSVEINNSFYQLPRRETLALWRQSVPDDFIFSAKASRYITHMKKLKDPEASIEKFFERIVELGERLGPVLFQLPPNWHYNHERLERFLDTLSRDFRYAFEFRNAGWINERCEELLARHDIAFCVYEFDGYRSPRKVTTDFVYVRLHGPDGPYQGEYDGPALADWADAITGWTSQGLSVYCYFDNDESGYAAQNALRLQRITEISGGHSQ